MYTSHELEHKNITEMGPCSGSPLKSLKSPILHPYNGVHVHYVTTDAA
jgi:hypothetical protein